MPELGVDYLRVTHPCASGSPYCYNEPLDLHVLGTPPAFILSQDQTLHENFFDLGENSLLARLTRRIWLCFQFSKSRVLFPFPPEGDAKIRNGKLSCKFFLLSPWRSAQTVAPPDTRAVLFSGPRKYSATPFRCKRHMLPY